jgi:hypothetical protein
MDGLTCNRLAVLGKPSSMGACCSGAAVPTGSHQRKESTTEAIGARHYWVTEGYCLSFTHGYRRLTKLGGLRQVGDAGRDRDPSAARR